MTYRDLCFIYEPYHHPTRVLVLARIFKDRKLISEQVVKIVDSKGVEAKKSALYFITPSEISSETPIYQKALIAAQRLRPFHTVFKSLIHDRNAATRSEIWSDILPAIDTLTVLPRTDGSIGIECYKEIVNCRDREIPILVFAYNTGEFQPFEKICRVSSQRRTSDFYAFAYPHSRPGYWDYAADELSRVWVESNTRQFRASNSKKLELSHA